MSSQPSLKPLSIFDTTLRDGEQAPGNSMTVEQKVRIGLELEALGVNVVETGFPAASGNDFRTTVELASAVSKARLCAFARATRGDIDTAFKAIRQAPAFQIEVLLAVSDIHLQYKRCISREDALRETETAVRHAAGLGVEDIGIAPEDVTRADLDFLHRMVDVAVESGATMVTLPDTLGCYLPSEFARLVKTLRSWVGEGVRVSVHAHNDLGLATANTLAAIEAGADECQVTLCGIGERAGNAALEEVVAGLSSRQEWFGRTHTIDTTKIYQACNLLRDTLRLQIPKAKPVIGENAFATAAGIHQSGLLRDPKTYQFLDPNLFGRSHEMVIERHSGRHALRARFEGMGIPLDDEELNQLYQMVLNSEQTAAFTDEDLLKLRRRLSEESPALAASTVFQTKGG